MFRTLPIALSRPNKGFIAWTLAGSHEVAVDLMRSFNHAPKIAVMVCKGVSYDPAREFI